MDLGQQSLTGIFPATPQTHVDTSPLELAFSPTSGLVQLAHDYPGELMYGETYGYRSGLNAAMTAHLTRKANILERFARPLSPGDTVLDIGSNDATLLKAFETKGLNRIGIDPSAEKFCHFYPADISLAVDFFSEATYFRTAGRPADIVTSIAMFYDLPDPVAFARQVANVMADDGIWHFEQSYLPFMLNQLAYDTVCQEHLEYYSLDVVRRILARAELEIADVTTNTVNGGSFAVTAVKTGSKHLSRNPQIVDWMLEEEDRLCLRDAKTYRRFAARAQAHAYQLKGLLASLKASGKRVLGLGASTKGNVVLQYAGLGPDIIDAISDVNPDKWECVTPGTHIPIISEAEARAMAPDYFLVLPWHFKAGIVEREARFLASGGKLIFPMPQIEIVGG